MIKECVGEHGIGWQLAHHDHFQAVVTATKPVLGQQPTTPSASARVRTKGNHDLHVGETHGVADVAERIALHRETVGEVR